MWKITEALNGIRLEANAVGKAIRALSEREREAPPYGDMPERLSSLEGRLAAALGEIEAGILRAESIKGAARASEERERGHMKRAEAALELAQQLEGSEDADPFELAARAYADVAAAGNGEASEALGLPSVPSGMENRGSGRDMAKAAKRR